jgi:hypothetical protein
MKSRALWTLPICVFAMCSVSGCGEPVMENEPTTWEEAVAKFERLGGRVIRASSDQLKVHLYNSEVTDRDLRGLRLLDEPFALRLDHTEISDDGLEYVGGMTNLESLSLQGTRVTDSGLEHLTGLTGLKALYLGETRVTGAGGS